MVHRFLTRESMYSQLLTTVNESERRIDHLKRVQETLSARLQELMIDHADTEDGGKKKKKDDSSQKQEVLDNPDSPDADIFRANAELSELNKGYLLLQERFKRINIVND